MSNVAEHIDYKVKQLRNQNKCFVRLTHVHRPAVQIYRHPHVVPDYMHIDYTRNLVVIVSHKTVVVVAAVALVDIEYLNSLHIPMVHIFRSILQVRQQQRNLYHNWEHYKHVDHNLDLNKERENVIFIFDFIFTIQCLSFD